MTREELGSLLNQFAVIGQGIIYCGQKKEMCD